MPTPRREYGKQKGKCGIGNLKKIDEQQTDERDSRKELEN
jgi:hypothetical protein